MEFTKTSFSIENLLGDLPNEKDEEFRCFNGRSDVLEKTFTALAKCDDRHSIESQEQRLIIPGPGFTKIKLCGNDHEFPWYREHDRMAEMRVHVARSDLPGGPTGGTMNGEECRSRSTPLDLKCNNSHPSFGTDQPSSLSLDSFGEQSLSGSPVISPILSGKTSIHSKKTEDSNQRDRKCLIRGVASKELVTTDNNPSVGAMYGGSYVSVESAFHMISDDRQSVTHSVPETCQFNRINPLQMDWITQSGMFYPRISGSLAGMFIRIDNDHHSAEYWLMRTA
ncbi:hypothetical protein QAD02_002335 [Eretmocerus hayati]|uniref:Uncharacterized protein n=1 Tax=Eretmocerus hayati TaxID=131215 RepID=A0ACC2NJ01_9HYME|nr:hypothetical protein QAD02_002335 [Eretmocerus hayati]